MYRENIRKSYDRLSRSYRKVADFIMSNYYEVSFMTAAQLAYAVGVDTTTVVRFSQRLGFNGYPDLLNDIRVQVRGEVYAAYEPQQYSPGDPAAIFRDRAKQEEHNLRQMQVHNPPEHVQRVAELVRSATELVFIAEGYADTVAKMVAQQLRHRGVAARAVDADPIRRAAMLATVPGTAVGIGVSATVYGHDVSRALDYLRAKGCPTIGVVGSLESPVNRVSDQVMYAPTDVAGPLPDIVALVAALSSLVHIATQENEEVADRRQEAFEQTFSYLIGSQEEAGIEDDDWDDF